MVLVVVPAARPAAMPVGVVVAGADATAGTTAAPQPGPRRVSKMAVPSNHIKNTNSSNKPPSLEPYVEKLERFELFSTNQCYYLVGCNKQNTTYRVLKMDRTLIERPPEAAGGGGRRHGIGATAASSPRHPPYAPPMPHGRSSFDVGSGGGGAAAATNFDTYAAAQLAADNNNNSTNAATSNSHHAAKPTLRPLSDFLTEDPNVYSQEEIKDMLDMIHDGNRVTRSDGKPDAIGVQSDSGGGDGGGLKPIVKAYGIVGFIRFLDCYYLTLTTRRAKVGSIGDNAIYTIKNTETIPLKPAERRPGSDNNADPSSVLLSMWNRGKRSVGLGLTNREIAELRYQGLYQVVDLTKNFYFSYTYDVTRSLQENFLAATTKPFPPPPFKDMYAWNFFLTREFENCITPNTSHHWTMPIIYGAFVQRKVNDYGRSLNILLVARRSRHFAGTRYLKRGVSEQGKVANDVEHEQILHDESRAAPGNFSSYLQVRGSIPTFWTQESSVTMPKPPIELNRVDPTYTATQLHFGDLLRRYSSPILVLDLVKQSEKREREVRVGNEFRHAVDYINHNIDRAHKIRYCALDYSHISKHRNLDVSFALNEVATWAVNQTGFFCSAPRWKIDDSGTVVPFTEEDGRGAVRLTEQLGVPVFPMEQNGVLRTNCIDCLDRTNVAQFSAGVEAMGQQLVVMGIRSRGKLGPSSSIVRVLIDLYVDIGDSIALQYGGSEAHKKVTAGVSESITGPIGKHKELLTSIRRYYSNAFTDRLKQDAMNLFLGFYLPFNQSVPLWELENDYYLHNYNVKKPGKATTSMKTYQRAFGVEWRDDDELTNGVDLETTNKTTIPPCPRRVIAPPRAKPSKPIIAIGGTSKSWEGESARAMRVRNRCNAQNAALSIWWKVALQANLKERMWLSLSSQHEDALLPGRFERVYQPEKLGQFDRFFSRIWETPVRRSHAAQHTGGVDDDDAIDFARVVTTDFTSPSNSSQDRIVDTNVSGLISLSKYVRVFGFEPRTESALKLFAKHFDKQAPVCPDFDYLGQSDAARMKNPPDEYVRYCAPSSQAFDHPQSYRVDRVEEFKVQLHDYILPSDDVDGVRELARAAHLSESIVYGEYRGLHKNTSAIEVATALHEQFNTLESLPSAGLQLVERELVRRGFDTSGMKESVATGWKRSALAEKQYSEIVEAVNTRCQRSALTSADSLQLYISEMDEGINLTTADRIFLQAHEPATTENCKTSRASNINRSCESSSFVLKAARLGISITPHERRTAAVPPPLYQPEQRQDVSVGFEQINEDMLSRKDNKFMVFNGAGVDSWSGTQPITKTSHAEDILLSTLK